jgi:uncharacterized protein (DUF58 family)
MLTARGWWFLIPVLAMLATGLVLSYLPLILPALSLVLWFAFEWLIFAVRARSLAGRLEVVRELTDERGPVRALWTGHQVQVLVTLRLQGTPDLPFAVAVDHVPFTASHVTGSPAVEGALSAEQPLQIRYRVRCGSAGALRFEGVRLHLADLQGFFFHSRFLRDRVEVPVLPLLVDAEGRVASVKRFNLLPPPGVHRFLRAGSGSELLDLRDYMPGDPPRTIAWKVSARRDRLITKEFESEVPIRCTLFVDASDSVRVPFLSMGVMERIAQGADLMELARSTGKPVQRLVEIAAAVLQASAANRDLTGLCLFDEHGVTISQPDRSGRHLTEMFRLLAATAGRAPAYARVEPEQLTPLAYSVASAVYPERLSPGVNSMPFWLQWVAAFPGFWRSPVSVLTYLFRRKQALLITVATVVPTLLFAFNLAASYFLPPDVQADLLAASLLGSVLTMLLAVLLFVGVTALSGAQRRQALWRKRLAALLAHRRGTGPAGLEALLEDNDLYALEIQDFLNEHQVPYPLPLYDSSGRYLYAAPGKIEVLARALLRAVRRGQDNELFVLLVDLLELDDLGPLLKAVRVALGRHHQVLLVCPWPPGLDLPARNQRRREEPAGAPGPGADAAGLAAGTQPGSSAVGTHLVSALRLAQRLPLAEALHELTVRRIHAAYQRVRHSFARLGVPVVCAASEEPVPLILDRIDRLRALRRRR